MTNNYKRDFVKMVFNYLPALFNDDTKYHIIAQLALESGYGTNYLSSMYRNISSMRSPKIRITTAQYFTANGFATYESLKDCVMDYVLWLISRGATQKNVAQVWRDNLHIYCPDDGYSEKVEIIYKEIINIIKEV